MPPHKAASIKGSSSQFFNPTTLPTVVSRLYTHGPPPPCASPQAPAPPSLLATAPPARQSGPGSPAARLRARPHLPPPPPPPPPPQVIKVGTSSLIREAQHSLNLSSVAGIVETVRDLKAAGYSVILVSSGAVGVGCQRLGLRARPDSLAKKQALAAVGQVHLMRYYDDLFSAVGVVSAGGRGGGACGTRVRRISTSMRRGAELRRPSPPQVPQGRDRATLQIRRGGELPSFLPAPILPAHPG